MSQPTSQPKDPRKSPTYPQRVHIRERAKWQELLKTWDERIASASGSGAGGEVENKRRVQMSGCRDQIAEAVRRLPMEVGDLYEEDKHRLEEAVAALERLLGPARA